jgi:hypothetical protein
MTESNQTSHVTDSATVTGPIWAAVLAAAFGCAVLGVLTFFTENSPRMAKLMTFIKPVGNLSGVTTLTLFVWIISWILLHRSWKTQSIKFGGLVLTTTLLLILIGLLGTFPPFIDWLGRK